MIGPPIIEKAQKACTPHHHHYYQYHHHLPCHQNNPNHPHHHHHYYQHHHHHLQCHRHYHHHHYHHYYHHHHHHLNCHCQQQQQQQQQEKKEQKQQDLLYLKYHHNCLPACSTASTNHHDYLSTTNNLSVSSTCTQEEIQFDKSHQKEEKEEEVEKDKIHSSTSSSATSATTSSSCLSINEDDPTLQIINHKKDYKKSYLPSHFIIANHLRSITRTNIWRNTYWKSAKLQSNVFFLLATFLALLLSPVMGGTSENLLDDVTSTVSALTTETPVIADKTRTGNNLGGSIDLLAALQLHNTTRQGVTQVPGLIRLKPAYYLQGDERDLQLNQVNFERAIGLLRRVPEFTVAASFQQEKANSGTIVAFSHGNNRYLELQSSGRKDELRLHYVSRRDGAVHVEAFPFRLADGAWHRVALSISGSQVELLVDCHPLYRRLLRPGPPDTNFTLPSLQLWVGQRNAKHFLFKGSLQDVKLISGPHGYLSQCPQLDTSCPTCGQFSILQNTVEQLMHNLNELTHRLAAAEGRISKVEECECQKSCKANGTVHEDGAIWEKGCQQCSCIHGEIKCEPTPCSPVTCKHPVVPQGQCCPVCLKQCLINGVIYDHGEKVSPAQCVECNCFDGNFFCPKFNAETRCPPLPCPPSEQINVAEQCCKICPGVDYCAKGHKCHANASCLNLQTTYACYCNTGFQGDGHNCDDVDECKQQGGLEGHHCNANTRCVNLVGSYMCECLPGYHRVDKFNCAEIDECTTGRHSCSEHATCYNTPGSYRCVCKDGYKGDGYTCKPICNQTCQNGGECIAPDRCSCRRGYIGNSCELDLDECASDLHRCHRSSTCINMPGWYYCRCKTGYRSALHDSTQGTQCLDIDECNAQATERRHTCHPTAKCINTDGGYECTCPKDDIHLNDDCRLSCWHENREIVNGNTFAPTGNPCKRCTCKDGVITCRDPICDCSIPNSRRDKCCPQCDPAASCRHQELHHLIFRSGERWIYQCQTCECLYGEIDCWQMECPPVTCSNPITEDGDCCPRCEDDPCAREIHINSSSLAALSMHPQPCSYAGIIHDSGSSWQDPHDKCTTCECKDGQLCCSYDYGCSNNVGMEQHAIVYNKSGAIRMPDYTTISNNSSKTTVSTIGNPYNINPTTVISNSKINNDYTTTNSPQNDDVILETTSSSPPEQKVTTTVSSKPSLSTVTGTTTTSSKTIKSTTSTSTSITALSTPKVSLLSSSEKINDSETNNLERSRSIGKSFPKTQSIRRQSGTRNLVVISSNKDGRKSSLLIGKRNNFGKASAGSRLVGNNDAT